MINFERLKEVLQYDSESGDFTWKVAPRGKKPGAAAGTSSKGYVRIVVDGKAYLAHRLAWMYQFGEFPAAELDHANRIRSDNRISNLRLATRSQNCINKSCSSDGYRGVHWSKRKKKWVAQIGINGKKKNLGYFKSKDEAQEAYWEEAAKLHGDFATFTPSPIP